jgi:DNA-directed RNA polymerase subunit omega
MQKISIDKLLSMINSRYSLVTVISKRARQIVSGEDPLILTKTTKPVSIAIEEFYDGKIKPVYPTEE